MRPHASVPAAVTTASRPLWRDATRSTTASAARVSQRSTCSASNPLDDGDRSSTIGVPPASSTAAAIAAPRPEAPPVTMMRWLSRSGTVGLRDERPARALQAADRLVAVQQHDEPVAESAGGAQRANVAGVEQIDAAAGGDDVPRRGSRLGEGRPYRPRTNGKAERFIKTLIAGWNDYNHHRPHGALSHQPPIARLNQLNNLTRSYS